MSSDALPEPTHHRHRGDPVDVVPGPPHRCTAPTAAEPLHVLTPDELARLLGDAEAHAWPCANYLSPLTCLTAPSSEAGRCDWCRGLLADAEAKAEARGRREVREDGLLLDAAALDRLRAALTTALAGCVLLGVYLTAGSLR